MATKTTSTPSRARGRVRAVLLSLILLAGVITLGSQVTISKNPALPSESPQPAQTTCVPPPGAKTCKPDPKLYVVLVKWSGLDGKPEGPDIKVAPEPLVADSAPVIDAGRWVAITTANPTAASKFAVTVGVSAKKTPRKIEQAQTSCRVFPFTGTQITLRAAEASIAGSDPITTGTGSDVTRCLVPR
ncbi:MAG TPA: hypothetical protein VMT30_08360 [Candidatus Saccharimonadia bacterium]|nr:hypothetical protein [Candidatus Saccharimonadia bacterium]